MDAQSRARSGHAHLRGGGHPGDLRGHGARQHVAGGGAGRCGHRRASGWSANLYTLASDLFPGGAVGSVVGLGGFGGAVGGMLVATLVGYWLDWSHGAYGPLFVIAGSVYLVAFAVIHWLVGRD